MARYRIKKLFDVRCYNMYGVFCGSNPSTFMPETHLKQAIKAKQRLIKKDKEERNAN